jgi:precorrin-2/cobalt-factor-2 C20-methyltransferase
MTVKAWRLISTARCIAYLAANGNESTARAIAAPFIPEEVEEIVIDMPMRVEREAGQAVYDRGTEEVAKRLDAGKDVVVLCEGDPFFYGSFIHIFKRLSERFRTIIVPGVTSVSASAATIGQPLCERNDTLKILPATMPEEDLIRELRSAPSAAILKVGRHFGKVRTVLRTLNLEGQATAVERATHHDQAIRHVADIVDDVLPYFTTIIVRR